MDLREPLIEVAIGVRGGGKSYRALLNMYQYLETHKNRNIIIFDANGEKSYAHIKSIDSLLIPKLKRVGTIRRVPNYNPKNGAPFDLDEKMQMCFYLMATVQHSLLVLEDLNNYILGTNLKGFISKITTNRHSDLDILIHLQSLSAVTPRLWQNCNLLRFHYTSENLGRIKKNIPDYALFRLAQIILQMYYQQGQARKFIYIDVQKLKFVGISINEDTRTATGPCELVPISSELFKLACATYLKKPVESPEVAGFIAENSYYIQ